MTKLSTNSGLRARRVRSIKETDRLVLSHHFRSIPEVISVADKDSFLRKEKEKLRRFATTFISFEDVHEFLTL